MPGKHNAGGCKCCGDPCWGCATPLGISVSIPSENLNCANCNMGTGTYLAGSAVFNNLGVSTGSNPCTAFWSINDDCCNVVTGRVYRWQRSRWGFTLTHGIASGNPFANVFARYDFWEWKIEDEWPGSGTGDPCAKAWNFLVNTQTIDGWVRTLVQANIFSQAHYRQEFLGDCPTTDQVLSFDPGQFSNNNYPCDADNLTVTLLMT
jgi:hypothetical protein